jgi:hypothetical protein
MTAGPVPAEHQEEGYGDISVLGGLGKNLCSVVGLDGPGNVAMRRRMTRETLTRADGEADWLRCRNGSLLRLSPPRSRVRQPRPVRPYVKAKNDDRDTEEIAEAARNALHVSSKLAALKA